MVFSIFTGMYNYYHNFSTFISPQKDTLYPLTSSPTPPPLPFPISSKNTNLLSVSIDFPVLNFYMNRITYYVVSEDWPLSLGTIFSRFTHVAALHFFWTVLSKHGNWTGPAQSLEHLV